MYDQLLQDVAGENPSSNDAEAIAARQKERIEVLRQMYKAGEIQGRDEQFKAAVILVDGDLLSDLMLAYDFALDAARQGDDRGFRVAAEAFDKEMVKQGLQQRYGTQFVYEPVIKAWRLYPCDPNTSDAERKAMGVAPMDELMKQAARLNRTDASHAAK